MRRVALGVAYDGGRFNGFQRQRDVPTVQGALEDALSRIAAEPIRVQGAGRTDRGVHATAQVVHFDGPSARPLKAWLNGTNALLPRAVEVRWAEWAPATFHARFSALERRYQYVFADPRLPLSLLAGRCWHSVTLNADAMHRAAQCLLGEQDFSAFRAAGCQSESPWRRVHQVTVRQAGSFTVLEISANAFLLHMVRNIARALHEVGRGAMSAAELTALLAGRDRTRLGPTAPPDGLYLTGVRYPQDFEGEDGQVEHLSLPGGVPAPLLAAAASLER